jgi:hypothetical protein
MDISRENQDIADTRHQTTESRSLPEILEVEVRRDLQTHIGGRDMRHVNSRYKLHERVCAMDIRKLFGAIDHRAAGSFCLM